jgi:hypothetical protein
VRSPTPNRQTSPVQRDMVTSNAKPSPEVLKTQKREREQAPEVKQGKEVNNPETPKSQEDQVTEGQAKSTPVTGFYTCKEPAEVSL